MPSMKQVVKQQPQAKPKARPSSNGQVSAWDLVDTVRMLLFGESGTGKTTLWATFPGPVLALICSGGRKPGELRSINTPEIRAKVTPRIVNTSQEFGQAIQDAADYATVVLDHGSGLADIFIKEILGVEEIPVAKYKRAGKGESWSLISQKQYGEISVLCKEAFRDLLNLPGNVVIVAQQRTMGGQDDNPQLAEIMTPTICAALQPSVVNWLNPACDYVVQAFKRPRMIEKVTDVGGKKVVLKSRGKGVDYCLRCEPHDVITTKFRIPKGSPLPDVIVDPTYDKLMQVIRGK